jgi:hypothetical protein
VILKTHHLMSEFSGVAQQLCRIIINEAALPAALKSVPTVDAGGVAGGEKFIVCGIFFKRVFDAHGIYGSGELSCLSWLWNLRCVILLLLHLRRVPQSDFVLHLLAG